MWQATYHIYLSFGTIPVGDPCLMARCRPALPTSRKVYPAYLTVARFVQHLTLDKKQRGRPSSRSQPQRYISL